MQLIILIAC